MSTPTSLSQTTKCIRCSKPRVPGRTWKETVAGSVVTYTQMVCPDKECQKLVDQMLKERSEKIAKNQRESMERRAKMVKRK